MNDEVSDREPPEHRWEELLRDVSSLAEKIRRQLGERAMFRGMSFWFTQLHRLGRWPAGWDGLRELCAGAWGAGSHGEQPHLHLCGLLWQCAGGADGAGVWRMVAVHGEVGLEACRV